MLSVEKNLYLWGGLTVIFSGLFWWIPGFNFLFVLTGIVGIILIIARLGFARGLFFAIMGITASLMIGFWFMGFQMAIINTVIFILVAIVPSFVMAKSSRDLIDPPKIAARGFASLMILFALFAIIYSGWINDQSVFLDQINQNIKITINTDPLYTDAIARLFPPADGSVDRFLAEFEKFTGFVLKIFPGLLLTLLLAISVFSYYFAGVIATKAKIIIPKFQPFYRWRASGWWLFPTIVGLIPVALMNYDLWFYVGLNILIVTSHIYMVTGLAIVEAFFKRFLTPLPLKIIFYIFLVFGTYVSMGMLAILGLLDAKFNFKREPIGNDEKN